MSRNEKIIYSVPHDANVEAGLSGADCNLAASRLVSSVPAWCAHCIVVYIPEATTIDKHLALRKCMGNCRRSFRHTTVQGALYLGGKTGRPGGIAINLEASTVPVSNLVLKGIIFFGQTRVFIACDSRRRDIARKALS